MIGRLPLNHHSGRFRSRVRGGGGGRRRIFVGTPFDTLQLTKFHRARAPPPPPPPNPGSAYAPCTCFGLQGTKLRNEILIPQVWICTKRAASLLEKVSLHQGWREEKGNERPLLTAGSIEPLGKQEYYVRMRG